jgi:two-component system, chemotaxis family, CheB/CheR fusion protein
MKTNKTVPEKSLKENKSSKASERFPIVGIGASAGGLEALDQFFVNVPESSGMAFVVVQHLDPIHKGFMPELIQRVTSMSVYQVTDNMKVKPNCIYIIPPNKNISILKGTLHLFDFTERHGLRLPIDFFFNSLADDLKENSIGIILSGMGSDGSFGARSIKEKAGIVLVQDPASAKYDGMPRNAIETVMADIIAPPNELPHKLITFLKHILTIKAGPDIEVKEKSALEKIIILIRSQTGNDFSQYKKSILYRRIERRMGIHKISRISSYIRFLQENPNEIEILFKELLIGATSFFRDNEVWEELKETVYPELIKEKPDGYVLRGWIPGCSTGEEAISHAIIIKEKLEHSKFQKNLPVQIFASDLDNGSIERARKGYFPANFITGVSQDRLKRFFVKEADGYKINSEIREMIVFASQNVIHDPPFTKLDFISCRNLLIYLEPELQKRLLAIFHYSLRSGGILVLGTSETLGSQSRLFKPINAKLRIFRKDQLNEKTEPFDLPSFFPRLKTFSGEIPLPARLSENIQSLTNTMILQQYAPASVLVTDKGDIIYLTKRAGKYLEPAAGKANMNIFVMLREGISLEFPIAFRKALKNYEKVILQNIKVGTNGGVEFVDIIIQQIEKPDSLKGMLIVVFKDVPQSLTKKSSKTSKGSASDNPRLKEMELEQKRLREELQGTLEAMQVSEEELKSSNEELQSTNEELQSTNEELTTSKEELQSMNEELQTVNFELMSKIDDFTRMSNDMKNLLESTDIATLFLDKALMIRRFTTGVTRSFKLLQSDIGRSICDLATDLIYPDFFDDMQEVLRKLVFIEKQVQTMSDKWFSVRIMPYRTSDDRIDGLVITLTDITQAKNLEAELNRTIAVLRSHNL